MRLRYRMHMPEDEQALIRLWADHSGWDAVSAETWAYRLLKPPLGAAAIVVAESAPDRIVGQFAFIPALVQIQGRERSALRPFAPILDPAVRSFAGGLNPLRNAVVAMYLHGVKALRARGDALIYMLPDPRWRRLLRVFPVLQHASFPLWSRPLPLAAPPVLAPGHRAVAMDPRDPRIDELWPKAAALHSCSLVRDSRVLPWKVGGGDYTLIGVLRGEELVGFVASKHKGDRQWLICDLLAADAGESMRAVLTAAVQAADVSARTARPGAIAKVAVLVTPVLQPHLEALGLRRDDYDFSMIVHLLDTSIPKADVAPGRWYVSAND